MPHVYLQDELAYFVSQIDRSSDNILEHVASADVIYRYIEFKWFKLNYEDKVLLFSRPESWADSIENPFLASRGFIKGQQKIGLGKSLSRVAFGQCWTTDQDIREWCWWRYHNANDVIRVGVDRDKYVKIIESRFGDQADVSVFDGGVNYWNDELVMREYIRQSVKNSLEFPDTSFRGFASTLFHKRAIHRDEREYRIVVLDHPLNALMSDQFYTIRIDDLPIVSVDIAPGVEMQVANEICDYVNFRFSINAVQNQESSIREQFWNLDV